MDTLGKLFGSKDIVRLLRFFLLSPNEPHDLHDIAKRTRVAADTVRTELAMLKSIGFVKRRSFYKTVERKHGGHTTVSRKQATGYQLDPGFPYLEGLQQLLAGPTTLLNHRDLLRKLGRVGRLKLVVLAGVFMRDFEGRLDLLLVGDRLRRRALESSIRDIEAELGREIRYAAFVTDDFLYRLSMRDRLVRDALDYAHDTVVDHLGVDRPLLTERRESTSLSLGAE